MVLVFYDFGKELLKINHIFFLGFGQATTLHFILLRHLEEKSRYDVSPLVEKVLLILLNVHQLVDDMQLQIKLLAIDCVL